MTFIEAMVTSAGDVLAVNYDDQNKVVTVCYVTPEDTTEQIIFPVEDMASVITMLNDALSSLAEELD